jgi:hypothetical protein
MDRYVPELLGARKARHVDRQLREIADLLRDTALDDAGFRTRSRAVLGRRLQSEFDRQATNNALDTAFTRPGGQPKELGHEDSYSSDH